MHVLKIERPGLGYYYEANVEVAVEELRVHLEAGDPGGQVSFTIVEMSEQEYEDLPEFTGW